MPLVWTRWMMLLLYARACSLLGWICQLLRTKTNPTTNNPVRLRWRRKRGMFTTYVVFSGVLLANTFADAPIHKRLQNRYSEQI